MQRSSWRRRVASAVLASALAFGGLVAVEATPAVALPTTIHVPADQPTISAALAVAVDGDTIEVAPGKYTEPLSYAGKDVAVVATGGPEATEVEPAGYGLVQIGPGGSFEGFTLRRSSGIRTTGVGSLIRGNRITQNRGGYGGAAIDGDGSSPIVDRNSFSSNTCGGDAQWFASVLKFNGGSPVLTNNVFTDNPCGAAIYLAAPAGSTTVVANNTILGGPIGLNLFLPGPPELQTIRNNIVVGATDGIRVNQGTAESFDHNLVFGNGTNYLGLADQAGSNGNLNADPLFMDQAERDLRLQAGSPAIDAANAAGAPTDDVLGEPRPVDGADAGSTAEFDIGAYERQGDELPLTPSGDTFHVPDDYATINAAMAVANDDDTIEVGPGTYAEKIDFDGYDIRLVATGGPGATTIDTGGDRGMTMGPGGLVEGFTISGEADSYRSALNLSGHGVVVRGNRFVGTSALQAHGASAITGYETDALVESNWFEGNVCDYQHHAAVVSISGGLSPVVRNNVFLDNPCGAAIALGTRAGRAGAILNNTIVGSYRGLYLDARGSGPGVVVRNNIIVDQELATIYVGSASVMPLNEGNLLFGSTEVYTGNTPPDDSGNLGGNPLFVNQMGRDLRLQPGSPAVDAARPAGAPPVDYDGTARPLDGPDADTVAEFDIGAFERDGSEPPAVRQTGYLDTTWSGDGWAPFPSRYSIALGPYSPNRIYSASYKSSDGNGPMRITKFNTTGAKIVGWGGANGFVLRSFSVAPGLSFPTHITSVGSQVTVAGESYTTNARLGVARLRGDGSYDPAFSGDGRALFKVFNYEHDIVSPFRVDVLSGGKIGIAVATFDYAADGNARYVGQAMVRLKANGSPDTSFSGDGKAIVPNDWSDIRFLPNGGAYVDRQLGTNHEVRKLLPSGQLDPSFSGDGIANASCGTHQGSLMAIDSAGRPVVMCVGPTDPTVASMTLTLLRFTTSGALDPSYSGDGKAVMFIEGAADWMTRVHLDQNAQPWAAIRAWDSSQAFHVYTLDANGNPNASWSGDGKATITLPFEVDLSRIERSGDRLYVTTYKDATNVAIIALRA